MWRERLEKKLQIFKIPNLMFIIIVVSAFVYAIDYISVIQTGRTHLTYLLEFNKQLILKGQIWRLVSFVFTPFSGGMFFVLLEAYFLYFLGTSLEVTLGDRKFSSFYMFGVFLTVIAGFMTGFSTIFYLNMTLFFVFASINPNRKMLLFFILPVNTIWLAALDLVYFISIMIISIIRQDFATLLVIVAAILNFLIFFGPRFFLDICYNIKSLQEKSKRM